MEGRYQKNPHILSGDLECHKVSVDIQKGRQTTFRKLLSGTGSNKPHQRHSNLEKAKEGLYGQWRANQV